MSVISVEVAQHPVVQDVADTAGFGDLGCHLGLYRRVCAPLVPVERIERLPQGQATLGGRLAEEQASNSDRLCCHSFGAEIHVLLVSPWDGVNPTRHHHPLQLVKLFFLMRSQDSWVSQPACSRLCNPDHRGFHLDTPAISTPSHSPLPTRQGCAVIFPGRVLLPSGWRRTFKYSTAPHLRFLPSSAFLPSA